MDAPTEPIKPIPAPAQQLSRGYKVLGHVIMWTVLAGIVAIIYFVGSALMHKGEQYQKQYEQEHTPTGIVYHYDVTVRP